MSPTDTPTGTPTVTGPVADNTKQWWKSKTLWLNVAGIIALVTQQFAAETPLDPQYQALALAAANLILRLFTNKGLR